MEVIDQRTPTIEQLAYALLLSQRRATWRQNINPDLEKLVNSSLADIIKELEPDDAEMERTACWDHDLDCCSYHAGEEWRAHVVDCEDEVYPCIGSVESYLQVNQAGLPADCSSIYRPACCWYDNEGARNNKKKTLIWNFTKTYHPSRTYYNRWWHGSGSLYAEGMEKTGREEFDDYIREMNEPDVSPAEKKDDPYGFHEIPVTTEFIKSLAKKGLLSAADLRKLNVDVVAEGEV